MVRSMPPGGVTVAGDPTPARGIRGAAGMVPSRGSGPGRAVDVEPPSAIAWPVTGQMIARGSCLEPQCLHRSSAT